MIKNRTIFTRDNLEILRGMDDASIDLVYLDPPFNSNRSYAAPVGSRAAGAEFKDSWSFDDTKDEWHGLIAEEHPILYKVIDSAGAAGGKGDKAYLIYMSMRLLELHRILKPTGCIYLHCDPTMSHGLKLVMDAVFGGKRFLNEFIWYYGGGGASTKKWGRKHDVLLFYARGDKWVFNADAVRVPHKWDKGQLRVDGSARSKRGETADDVFIHHGVMPWAQERTGYPTQKPLALLERIVAASSNKGDMVLDPFCGCATTCVASEKLEREWIGIDINPKAADLIRERLVNDIGITSEKEGMLLPRGYVIHRTDIPHRKTDTPPTPKGQIKRILFGQQKGRCNGCGHTFDYRHFEIDHIVPVSKGGTDNDENKQLLCGNCNRHKGTGTMAELFARLRQLGITRTR